MNNQIIASKNEIINEQKKFSFMMPSMDEMKNLIEFCKVMASSQFYQKLGSGGVLAIYMTAKEFDLPFMACLNGGLHTFDGKVTFSAIMIDALILKAGHKTEILKLDENECTIKFIRGDRKNDSSYKPFVFTYTKKQAANAGYLTKNNWKSSPVDMLYSRCITGGGRKHIPEVFVGVLVVGELVNEDADGNIAPLIPATVNTNVVPESNESVDTAPPKELEFVKSEGFDEFCKQHELFEDTRKSLYIEQIQQLTNQSKEKIINHAIKNSERFLSAFEKWDKENNETVTN